MRKESSTGEVIDVLPVGTRIRHTDHKTLTGRIVRHEYHESGKISPLPYLVHWDQEDASRVLGLLGSIYPMRSEIEIIPVQEVTDVNNSNPR